LSPAPRHDIGHTHNWIRCCAPALAGAQADYSSGVDKLGPRGTTRPRLRDKIYARQPGIDRWLESLMMGLVGLSRYVSQRVAPYTYMPVFLHRPYLWPSTFAKSSCNCSMMYHYMKSCKTLTQPRLIPIIVERNGKRAEPLPATHIHKCTYMDVEYYI
jgi:hypothetical protein